MKNQSIKLNFILTTQVTLYPEDREDLSFRTIWLYEKQFSNLSHDLVATSVFLIITEIVSLLLAASDSALFFQKFEMQWVLFFFSKKQPKESLHKLWEHIIRKTLSDYMNFSACKGYQPASVIFLSALKKLS